MHKKNNGNEIGLTPNEKRRQAQAASLGSGHQAPFGSWELSLSDSEELRMQFKEDLIQNILFVITYEGLTPEWPY